MKAALAAVLALSGCSTVPPVTTAVTPSHAVSRPSAARSVRTAKISYPAQGGRQWRTAPAAPHTGGDSGTLLRYRVRVENDITGLSVRGFADAVTATLNDRRGWTAGGTLRLRRVGPGAASDFTVYLATPRTRDVLCASGTDGYTSCRNDNKVVLNVARWAKSVPGYGASLATYRQYMVNHEVGHRLGHGHERCPAEGDPAPVMQQQTLGLHGCLANPWPYPRGTLHAGPSGAYDDRVPPPDKGLR